MRCINENKTKVVEGKLRCKELSEYLDSMQVEKRIWISEDATAITSNVTYDPSTNQLVGIVLPTDKKNGCPIPLSFEAKNERVIKEYLNHTQSHFVYLIMAQPLNEKIPPFVLQMFGTNSEFKSKDVIARWNSTKLELKKYSNLMFIIIHICFQVILIFSIDIILNWKESHRTEIQNSYQLCAIN